MDRRKFFIGGSAAGLLAFSGRIHAATDWLDLPARLSSRASSRLMLALAKDSGATGQTLLAAGQRGIALFSEDGGQVWQQAVTPVYVTLTALFAREGRAYAAGHDGIILKSLNGGRTWVRLLDGRDGNALTLAAANRRLKLSRQDENARQAFDDIRSTLEFGPANPLFGIAARINGGRETIIAVGAFGQVFRSHNGGAQWESLLDRFDNADNLHHNSITLTRTGEWVITSEAGRIYVSVDDGDSWRRVETGYNGALFGAVEGPAEMATLWVHGFAGSLFLSQDRGFSWHPLPGLGRQPLVGSALSASGRVAIVSLNGIVHVADGERWYILKDKMAGLASAICSSGENWIVAGNKGVQRLSGEPQS